MKKINIFLLMLCLFFMFGFFMIFFRENYPERLPRSENGGSHAPSVRQTEFLAGRRAKGGS